MKVCGQCLRLTHWVNTSATSSCRRHLLHVCTSERESYQQCVAASSCFDFPFVQPLYLREAARYIYTLVDMDCSQLVCASECASSTSLDKLRNMC